MYRQVDANRPSGRIPGGSLVRRRRNQEWLMRPGLCGLRTRGCLLRPVVGVRRTQPLGGRRAGSALFNELKIGPVEQVERPRMLHSL